MLAADGIQLGVDQFPQCLYSPFRNFTAFWAIETTSEFLFVGMAIASPMRVLFKPLTAATSPAAYPEGHRRIDVKTSL
jgi:hypothetical protein